MVFVKKIQPVDAVTGLLGVVALPVGFAVAFVSMWFIEDVADVVTWQYLVALWLVVPAFFSLLAVLHAITAPQFLPFREERAVLMLALSLVLAGVLRFKTEALITLIDSTGLDSSQALFPLVGGMIFLNGFACRYYATR